MAAALVLPAAADAHYPPAPAYLRARPGVANRTYPWGGVRARDEYVVAPPSRHPRGVAYEFEVGLDDADLADFESLHLPALETGREGLSLLSASPRGVARASRLVD